MWDDKEINSPFRWAGGKFYARKLILKHVMPHVSYIEPFAGGASIFFAKTKVRTNWLNDVDGELVNCLVHIRDHCERLIAFLDGIPATKELHSYYKNEFVPQNDLERAGRYYYLNRTSYSGIMKRENCYWGYGDKYSMRPENWPRHLKKCSSKLQNVRITLLDFRQVIEQAPDNSFLFIDPPYFNADQDKFYTCCFTRQDHYDLAELLQEHTHRLKFLITYDNVDEVKELYGWVHNISDQEWNYTISRTDDQSGKTDKKGSRRKGKEIFIRNYLLPEEEQNEVQEFEIACG